MAKIPAQEIFKAIWINSSGFISIRDFKIVEKQTKNTNALAEFMDKRQCRINTKFLRKKILTIIEQTDGTIAIINPEKWKKIPLGSYDIKEFRFNLQNFRIQESKSAMSRWTMPKSTLDKILPIFKMLLIAAAVGVIGWAAFKFAAQVLSNISSALTIDCGSILPHLSTPVGAGSTAATPIG